MKYIYLISILVLFQGCVFTTSTVNKANHKSSKIYDSKKNSSVKKDNSSMYNIQIQTVKKTKQIKTHKTLYSGSIKGIIEKLKYQKSKNMWFYAVRGMDTSNAKLPYAEFYSSKKLANIGDFVYAILNNSNLKDLFFIKKANKIAKKPKLLKKTEKQKKIHRRDKSRKSPGIGVPTVENVTF